MKYRRAITFGTYDLFHVGHVRILQRAAALADELVVGISTDELNLSKKQHVPITPYCQRAEIVSSCRYVTSVFSEENLAKKREYILRYQADVLVMGDDWAGRFDEFKDICEVIYLPRTEDVSTTELVTFIQKISCSEPSS